MAGRYNLSTGKFADGRSWSSIPYRGRNGTLRCHPRAIDWEERYNGEYDWEEDEIKVSIREEKEKKEMIEAFKEQYGEPIGEPIGDEESYVLPSIFEESCNFEAPRDKDGNPIVPKVKDSSFLISKTAFFITNKSPADILSLIDETLKEMKDFAYIIDKDMFCVSGWNINGGEQEEREICGNNTEFTANIYDNEDGTYLVDIRRQVRGNGLDVYNILNKCKEKFGISCYD